MPDGVMQWFDPEAGEGRIVHNGRRFSVRAEGAEPRARVPGAKVHFDIDSRAEGSVAVNVRLTPGTRVSRRQRRFGDLTGAASVDAKGTAPFSRPHPDMGADLPRHPMRVAEAWAESMGTGAVDEAMLLYGPEAVLHEGGDVVVGPDAIRRRLDTLVVPRERAAEVAGRGADGAVVRWTGLASGQGSLEVGLRMRHGEIAEQWLRSVREDRPEPDAGPPVDLSYAGAVDPADLDRLRSSLAGIADVTDEPVLHVDARLERSRDPARERPVKARATLDLDGEPVRAHVRAATTAEAIESLTDRLRRQVRDFVERRRDLRRRPVSSRPGEWRRGDAPDERPEWHPRPPDERSVVRHKTYGPAVATPDEAAFDLDALDYDFFLFTDLATGRDALVERQQDGAVTLALVGGHDPDHPRPATETIGLCDPVPPVLDLVEARGRLDLGGDRRVFYEDDRTGRGRVLYRRDDGHYGLITPADEE